MNAASLAFFRVAIGFVKRPILECLQRFKPGVGCLYMLRLHSEEIGR